MWRKLCSITSSQKLKIVLLILLSLGTAGNKVFSQRSTYVLNKKKDIAYASLSLVSWASFSYFEQQAGPLSIDQVNKLQASSVPSYDRVATLHYSVDLGRIRNI
jgi:hypothetical protein